MKALLSAGGSSDMTKASVIRQNHMCFMKTNCYIYHDSQKLSKQPHTQPTQMVLQQMLLRQTATFKIIQKSYPNNHKLTLHG